MHLDLQLKTFTFCKSLIRNGLCRSMAVKLSSVYTEEIETAVQLNVYSHP